MKPIWFEDLFLSLNRYTGFDLDLSLHQNSSFLLRPIFVHGLSASFHLIFLILLTTLWICRRLTISSGLESSKTRLATRNFLYKSTLLCCLGLALFHLFLCVFNYLRFWTGSSELDSVATQLDLVLRTFAWSVITGYLQFQIFPNPTQIGFPLLLRIWFTIYFFLSFSSITIDVVCLEKHRFVPIRSWVLDFTSILIGSFLCYAGFFAEKPSEQTPHVLQEPLLNESSTITEEQQSNKRNGVEIVSPYSNANFFSILTFSWMGSLISAGSKKPLDLADVPQLASSDSVNGVYSVFRSKLESECSRNGSSVGTIKLVRALLFSAWKQVLLTAFYAFIYTCASYVGPFLIDSFVKYLNGHEQFDHEGYVLVSVFFVAKLVECFAQRHWFFKLQQVGIRWTAALVAMIYKKGLSLPSQSKQGHTSGEIINFMSVDAERIGDFSWYMHDVWMVPVQVVLALLILYKNLGLASVAALAATVVVMLANMPLSKMQEKFQDKLMESKDRRMKTTSEILRNMRILKLQGWEMKFLSKIIDLRKHEAGWLRKFVYTSSIATFVFWGAPSFISVVSFGACKALGIPLESGRVLSALATFRILQEPIYNLPETISIIIQTKVSLDRISSFLRLEELQADVIEWLPKDSPIAIEISNGTFSWDPSSEIPTLKDLNFQVRRGSRVAVCGTVGSGKSGLLSCILGEVPKISGAIRVSGSKAYVAQSPWIQSGKIVDNILFGKEMERDKYERVLQACSLKKDLEILSFGDETVIGERGINLSGGQKQRIQIARALYQDADIYLFDDPFSAVDAHTGTHLFQECLLGLLNSKTVIYVTHQVEFLPSADLILVMRDGRITQAGRYENILSSGTDFMELVGAHKKALSSLNSTEPGSQAPSILSSGTDFMELVGAHKKALSSLNLTEPGSQAPSTQGNASENPESNGPRYKENNFTDKKYEIIDDQNSKITDEHAGQKGQLIQEEEREKGKVGFQVYWNYLTAAYGGALVPFILLAQILFQLLQIGSNYWMAWATPASKDTPSHVSSSLLILVYIILAISSALCILVRALLLVTAGYMTATLLFERMHKCIFRAPMSFFDSTPCGRLLNRASTDQSAADLSIPNMIGAVAFSLIQLLGIIGVMSQVAWQVFIIFIPVIATCLWYQQYYIPTARELARLDGVCKAPIIQHFSETIAGSTTIRSFDQESRFFATNLRLINEYSQPNFYSAAAMEWLCVRLDMLSSITFAFSLVFLVSMPRGLIDPGIAGLAVTYGLNLNMLQALVIWNLCNLENKIISIERILQYTRIPSEPSLVIERNRPDRNWPSHGEVSIHDLQVRYAPHMPLVLRGLTCTLPGGMKTGIVGRTGSGKSTLVQTLFRIVDPVSGRIVIDGIDISTLGLHDLRLRLSIIPQDPTMFEGTVRTNLDPLGQHTDDQIWEALGKCQLGEEVKQKEGKLDSIVTENGENWSMGQRQLVCLGRVLLKKSKVLVLDEATASVDTATDSLIQQTLRQHFSDSTVITIAHRIASVLDSDMVLLLNNGMIAEYDTPTKLLEDKSSAFAKLVAEYTMRSSDVLV